MPRCGSRRCFGIKFATSSTGWAGAGTRTGKARPGGCQTVSVQGVRQSRRGQHDGSDNGNIQIYMAAGHVEIMPSNWYQQSQRRASWIPLPPPPLCLLHLCATPGCLPACLPACWIEEQFWFSLSLRLLPFCDSFKMLVGCETTTATTRVGNNNNNSMQRQFVCDV